MKKLRIFLPFYRKTIKRMSKGYGIGKTKPGRLILKIITYMFRSNFVEVQGHKMFLHPGGEDYSLYGVYGELDTKIVKREIKKGDIVGVIGDSGVGKSTLVNILLGILKPNSGELILNNKILNKRNFINWQKFVGYVPQETYLMNESIKNNIAIGVDKKSIDDEKVEFALSKANIKNFVDDLEGGKDSLCGENGINMSGGQKQRLGIARALYRNPEFLIFDEPTSSLDINTEKDLLQDLLTMQDKTIIIVSHRLNVIKACSKILFLDKDGKFDFGEKEEIVKKYKFLEDCN